MNVKPSLKLAIGSLVVVLVLTIQMSALLLCSVKALCLPHTIASYKGSG